MFSRTDRGYTGGGRLSLVTPPTHTPKALQTFFKDNFWPFQRWSSVRTEYALNLSVFTPDDTARPIPDSTDRPYASWLEGTFALIGETLRDRPSNSDNRRRLATLDHLSIGLGLIGPDSLGGAAQTFIHRTRNIALPQGWAHQLREEPTLQLRYQRSWRYDVTPKPILGMDIDATPHAGFAAGNAFTYASAGITLRLGNDLRDDYGPPRIKPSVPGSDFFVPRDGFGWYVFAGFEGRAVARNIFLDGNTFQDSPHVSKYPFVGDAQAGLVVIFRHVRLAYTQVWRTKEFQGASMGDNFGAVSASFRFRFD